MKLDQLKYTSYSKFTQELKHLFPQSKDDYLCSVVRRVCMDFAYRSKILKRYIEQDIYCGINEYPLLYNTNECLVRFYNMIIGDNMGYSMVNIRAIGEVRTHLNNNMYTYTCSFTDDDGFILTPTPNKPMIAKYSLCISPTIDSKGVDEVIYRRHYNTILHGCYGRLYLETSKQGDLASYYNTLYSEAISAVGADKAKEFNEPRIQVGRLTLL